MTPRTTQGARGGRLTEEERDLLTALREEPPASGLPEDADRWSTWDTGERGPLPHPSWLVTELAAVDQELGVLKTGKEADVELIRRSVPGTARECLLAAKRYRAPDHRRFHRDAEYLEGRRMRKSRENRAMSVSSSFGRGLLAEQWAVAEFRVLGELRSAGIPVPYPVQRVGTEVLLEFVGDADGSPAPRLAELRPTPDVLEDLWIQTLSALFGLAEQGLTHGDLSCYNVLVHNGEIVLIDLPQAVDVVANPSGTRYLERDVRNITDWFRSRGLPEDRIDLPEVSRSLSQAARLLPR
ncbi:RIO1 family regulatory kinase/ATPase domain-containing protein [Actinopolyspora lacussalsi]|uniref:RIO1 family regulatory kinase/ATPase domain-containing protein n=1 Tax=Actinopolyspora righensis TaxID=995060 RepID=UPI000B842DFD